MASLVAKLDERGDGSHLDGEGSNIRLYATPVDGNIVLRTAKEKKQTPEGDEA